MKLYLFNTKIDFKTSYFEYYFEHIYGFYYFNTDSCKTEVAYLFITYRSSYYLFRCLNCYYFTTAFSCLIWCTYFSWIACIGIEIIFYIGNRVWFYVILYYIIIFVFDSIFCFVIVSICIISPSIFYRVCSNIGSRKIRRL